MRNMKNKNEVLGIRLSPELLAEINDFARVTGEDNTSAAARLLIRAGLRDWKEYNENALPREIEDFEPLPFSEPPLPER